MNNKNTAIAYFQDLLEKEVPTRTAFEAAVHKFPNEVEVITAFYEGWKSLEDWSVPDPSPQMDILFYEALEKERVKQVSASNSKKTNYKLLFSVLGVAATLFIAGMLVGPFFQEKNIEPPIQNNTKSEMPLEYAGYNNEVSATDRLENVHKIKELNTVDEKIIEALNQALLQDPNINVRLSAIEALLHFADHPEVRQTLIEAIPHQTSPIIQLTLAEVMIELQEKKSKNAFKKLLKSKDMEADVKKQLEETLELII